jgi:hypothetical protein
LLEEGADAEEVDEIIPAALLFAFLFVFPEIPFCIVDFAQEFAFESFTFESFASASFACASLTFVFSDDGPGSALQFEIQLLGLLKLEVILHELIQGAGVGFGELFFGCREAAHPEEKIRDLMARVFACVIERHAVFHEQQSLFGGWEIVWGGDTGICGVIFLYGVIGRVLGGLVIGETFDGDGETAGEVCDAELIIRKGLG